MNTLDILDKFVFHYCSRHGKVIAKIIRRVGKGIEAKYCCGAFETNYYIPSIKELLLDELERENLVVIRKEKGKKMFLFEHWWIYAKSRMDALRELEELGLIIMDGEDIIVTGVTNPKLQNLMEESVRIR